MVGPGLIGFAAGKAMCSPSSPTTCKTCLACEGHSPTLAHDKMETSSLTACTFDGWNAADTGRDARVLTPRGASYLVLRSGADRIIGRPLIFKSGPLVGTAMPSAGRCSACALSPLTSIWGEANTGGFVGPEMRFAGHDGVPITGWADRPVFLSILEGCAELHDDGGQGQDRCATAGVA